eukprot:401423_1
MKQYSQKSYLFINSFCIQNNWKSFMKTRDIKQSNYSFCDGIRVIASYWVLLFHLTIRTLTNKISMNAPSTTGQYIDYLYPKLESDNIYSDTNNWQQFIPSTFVYNLLYSLASMHIFFWLSGFFGCYSMIRILEKWKNKRCYVKQTLLLYFKRYLRLLPIIIFVLIFNLYFYDQMPYSFRMTSRNEKQTKCEQVWHSQIFLYSNLYRIISYLSTNIDPDQCVEGIWYLCVDFQCYLYLPIVCFLYVDMNHHRRICNWSFIACIIPIFTSIVTRVFFSAYLNYYESPWSHQMDANHDLTKLLSYRNPFIWAASYFIGTLTMLLFIHIDNNYNKKWTLNYLRGDIYWALQILALLLMSVYLFSPYTDFNEWPVKKWSTNTSQYYYYTFGGLLFCLGLSLFVFCLRYSPQNYYSITKQFLSANIFQILSKLTFMII